MISCFLFHTLFLGGDNLEAPIGNQHSKMQGSLRKSKDLTGREARTCAYNLRKRAAPSVNTQTTTPSFNIEESHNSSSDLNDPKICSVRTLA